MHNAARNWDCRGAAESEQAAPTRRSISLLPMHSFPTDCAVHMHAMQATASGRPGAPAAPTGYGPGEKWGKHGQPAHPLAGVLLAMVLRSTLSLPKHMPRLSCLKAHEGLWISRRLC